MTENTSPDALGENSPIDLPSTLDERIEALLHIGGKTLVEVVRRHPEYNGEGKIKTVHGLLANIELIEKGVYWEEAARDLSMLDLWRNNGYSILDALKFSTSHTCQMAMGTALMVTKAHPCALWSEDDNLLHYKFRRLPLVDQFRVLESIVRFYGPEEYVVCFFKWLSIPTTKLRALALVQQVIEMMPYALDKKGLFTLLNTIRSAAGVLP